VLLTNILHHFDTATCEKLLRKVRAALADGGRAVTLEFVPNRSGDWLRETGLESFAARLNKKRQLVLELALFVTTSAGSCTGQTRAVAYHLLQAGYFGQ
jgi:O-methyltransferase domain